MYFRLLWYLKMFNKACHSFYEETELNTQQKSLIFHDYDFESYSSIDFDAGCDKCWKQFQLRLRKKEIQSQDGFGLGI